MTERIIQGGNFVFFGGSTGIGRAAALELGRRRANVLIIGRGREAGEAAAAAVKAAGAASASFASADLSTVSGVGAAADQVLAWRRELHGVMHTAMAAFSGKTITNDGLEFAFALQYFARAALNRRLVDALEASGDGRIVHIAGNVPGMFKPDLDDLEFQQRKWSFFRSVLGTHVLGFLHIQEAARRWRDRPVTICAACVGPTKTKSMADRRMPLSMRLMGALGGPPEASAINAVRLLTNASARDAHGAVLRNPKTYEPTVLALDPADAARLWALTGEIGGGRGLALA